MKIIIDQKSYDVECREGEEDLLKDAGKIINEKFSMIADKENLSDLKKFLIVSLMLAGDLKLIKNELENTNKELDIIDNEILLIKKKIELNDE